MRINCITKFHVNKNTQLYTQGKEKQSINKMPEALYKNSPARDSFVSFRGSEVLMPIEVLKNEVYTEENFEKIRKYVTNPDDSYNGELGAQFALALNITRSMIIPPQMRKDYIFLKEVERKGSPELGEYLAAKTGVVSEINENIQQITDGVLPLQDYVSSVKNVDIRAKIAQVLAKYLETPMVDMQVNKAVEDTIGAYEISHNSKTGKYNLSDYKYKVKLAYQLKNEFDKSFDEIINTSRLSNGDVSTDLLTLYVIKEYYKEDFYNVRTFEKHCLDENGKIKDDEFSFFARCLFLVNEETSDEIFKQLTDKETGKFDNFKGQKYSEAINETYRQIARENARRVKNNEELLVTDPNKIAIDLLRKYS